MTYAAESQKSGRRFVHYLEVNVDECAREWGAAPCSPPESRKYYDDSFTDTDGTAVDAHTATNYAWVDGDSASASNLQIWSNRVLLNTVGSYGLYMNSTALSPAAAEISADFQFNASEQAFYMYVRSDSTTINSSASYYEISVRDDWYFGDPNGQILIFRKIVSGSSVDTISSDGLPTTRGAWQNLKVVIGDSVITVYLDDALILTYNDSGLPSTGYFGFLADNPSSWISGDMYVDNFSFYNQEVNTSSYAGACYKTRSTCAYPQAYSAGTKTHRFFESTQDALDLGLDGFPLLTSARTAPARIAPGKGLGVSAELTARLNDARHHDRGVDPYVSNRIYTPEAQGTFWGKWLARNKYYTNRTVRYYDGFLTDAGYSSANFRSREYIITKIDREKDGGVKIKCDDVLQKLNTAVAPEASEVYLTSDITSSATTIPIDVSGDSEFPVYLSDGVTIEYIEPFAGGVPFFLSSGTSDFIPLTVDNELPFYTTTPTYDPIPLIAPEFQIGEAISVRIGSELIRGTMSANQIESAIRGYRGSTAAGHDTGDTVQKCIDFINEPATDALETVMAYAGIGPSQIDTAGWAEQESAWLGLVLLDGIIHTPTKVKNIVKDLCIQGTVYIWWDEFDKLIKLLAVAPQGALGDLPTYNDDYHFLERSTATEQNMREQVTQLLVWYDKLNGVEGNDANNFRAVLPAYDAGAESDDQWRLVRSEQIEAQFITNEGHASSLGNRIIGRLRDGEQVLKFQMDIKETLGLGDEFVAETDAQQGADGAPDTIRMQVIEMSELGNGKMQFEAMKSAFQATRYAFIGPATLGDYGTATEEERSRYAFISNAQGFMSDGTEGYKII